MQACVRTDLTPLSLQGESFCFNVETHNLKNTKITSLFLNKVWVFYNTQQKNRIERVEVWRSSKGICKVSLYLKPKNSETIRAILAPLKLDTSGIGFPSNHWIQLSTTDEIKMRQLLELIDNSCVKNAATEKALNEIHSELENKQENEISKPKL